MDTDTDPTREPQVGDSHTTRHDDTKVQRTTKGPKERNGDSTEYAGPCKGTTEDTGTEDVYETTTPAKKDAS